MKDKWTWLIIGLIIGYCIADGGLFYNNETEPFDDYAFKQVIINIISNNCTVEEGGKIVCQK